MNICRIIGAGHDRTQPRRLNQARQQRSLKARHDDLAASFQRHAGGGERGDGDTAAGNNDADDNGVAQATFPLAPEYQGCGFDDPGHGYDDYFDQFAGGALNGWLVGQPDTFPIGYDTQDDLGFFGSAAPAWTTFDRYFAATPGPTFPNRFYQHSAQTDRLSNDLTIASLPTIRDRLESAGRTGRYYFNDIPFLALYGTTYLDITRPFAEFLTDAAAGNLPAVCYVDPGFAAPVGPHGLPCAAFSRPSLREEFAQSVPMARNMGFPLPDYPQNR